MKALGAKWDGKKMEAKIGGDVLNLEATSAVSKDRSRDCHVLWKNGFLWNTMLKSWQL